MVGLGDLPGRDFRSQANDISADGSVIVGRGTTGSTIASGNEAFIWTETEGMQNLKDVLVDDFGLDLTGWQLIDAVGVSDDGLSIVGYGFNPQGSGEAWIARLDSVSTPVPEPSSVLGLFLITGFGVIVTKRQT
jgi:uncharacterized membrane protein